MKRLMKLSWRTQALLARRPSWLVPERVEVGRELRTGMVADLQLVCGAGPYELDVLVRGYEAPAIVDIAGQVTRAENLHEPVADLSLSLVEAKELEVVSATSTDDFGEFGFSAGLGGVLGIRFGEDEEAPCVLVWDGY